MNIQELEEEKYFVVNAMKKYGGSFVKALGEALAHADIPNIEKIYLAFPEYWKQYLEMGRQK